jgi:protein SCO1/2
MALMPLLVACDRNDWRDAPAARPSPTASISARGPDAPSIYDLEIALVDQDGRPRTLADLRGRIVVSSMIYGSCASVCPRVTQDMKRLEQQLSSDHDGVTFVLFSLDADRDTPVALRRFAASHALRLPLWELFAASADGVRDLAAVLGVKYRQEAGGEIAHSALIVVIDREGVVRHRQVGLTPDPAALIAAVRECQGGNGRGGQSATGLPGRSAAAPRERDR